MISAPSDASTRPIATMRPSAIATSARTRGAPVPSKTRPFLITAAYRCSIAMAITPAGTVLFAARWSLVGRAGPTPAVPVGEDSDRVLDRGDAPGASYLAGDRAGLSGCRAVNDS